MAASPQSLLALIPLWQSLGTTSKPYIILSGSMLLAAAEFLLKNDLFWAIELFWDTQWLQSMKSCILKVPYRTRNSVKLRAISTKMQSINVRWRIKLIFLLNTSCNAWKSWLRRGFISSLDTGCQSKVGQPFSLGTRERQPLPEAFHHIFKMKPIPFSFI